MLRGIRLFHAQALDQSAGRKFTFTKLFDNRDASGVRQCLKKLGFKPT